MYDEIYQRLKKRKMGTWKEYFTFILMIRFPESIYCWAEWNSILFISLLTQPGIVFLERIWFQTVSMIILW